MDDFQPIPPDENISLTHLKENTTQIDPFKGKQFEIAPLVLVYALIVMVFFIWFINLSLTVFNGSEHGGCRCPLQISRISFRYNSTFKHHHANVTCCMANLFALRCHHRYIFMVSGKINQNMNIKLDF